MTASSSVVAELCVPADWAELLLPDDDAAHACFDELARATWPSGPVEVRAAAARALLSWRAAVLARGAVSHGVVSAPHPGGGTATWHVLSAVVTLPAVGEVDLGALLAELLRAQGAEELLHVEAFETDLGLGVGLVAEHTVVPPPQLGALVARGIEVVAGPVAVGVAAALACAPGAEQGLLVVGVSLAPEQVWEVAGLVAVVTGRSRLHPAPSGDQGEDRSG
ncbi:hypothetical protein [Blastococcus sp. SYSU DS0973]